MAEESWYEILKKDDPLKQGELILACPLPVAVPFAAPTKASVIVGTQSCDLEWAKVANVVLCPNIQLSDYEKLWREEMVRKGQGTSKDAWKRHVRDLLSDAKPNFMLLKGGSVDNQEVERRIVDFRDLFTMPLDYLEFLVGQGRQPRLCLRSPYREGFARVFANFFMRIAFPDPPRDSDFL